MAEKNFFEELYSIYLKDRMFDKQGLAYIPWATAFAEVAKKYPDVTYEIKRFGEKQLPYVESDLGIMVFTSVTINGITREMCLPVMDGANKAMKSVEYTYKVRTGEKTVSAATMFDINKSIMRCFAKNLAMFGLGLHLWTKDAAPEAVLEFEKIKGEVWKLFCEKAKISDAAKDKANEFCKKADPSGDPREIEDIDVLKQLKKELMGIRK